MNPEFWAGRSVLITGHTGFKGSWLSLLLHRLGASVSGFALAPPTIPSLYELARVGEIVDSTIADIRQLTAVTETLNRIRPDLVIHLAAQSIVKASYDDPVGTFETNVIGTVNLLEAIRRVDTVRAVVNVTSDKCYADREWVWPYRESDALGGHDPYSSSKAASEVVTAAYRSSFLAAAGIGVATARAGNVLGGGDWTPNQLVPDLMEAFLQGNPGHVRSPASTRPWQHALEAVGAYLVLAEALVDHPDRFSEAWNFGPDDSHAVADLADLLAISFGDGVAWEPMVNDFPHEAQTLRIDSSKARSRLQWKPRWSIETAARMVADWYRQVDRGADPREVTMAQVEDFLQLR